MAFDPTKPATGAPVTSAGLRDQFNGLHTLIPAAAAVDSVTTLPPGQAATATAALTGGTLHFTFQIPAGADGATGPPGEVTMAQLNDGLAQAVTQSLNMCLTVSSANTNGIGELSLIVSNPPTAAEVQAVVDKLNELILGLRR